MSLGLMGFCHVARAEKARKVFPRPVAGALRPVVHGQTIKYNLKKRYGRGFTLDELKVLRLGIGSAAAYCLLDDWAVSEQSIYCV